MLFSLRTEAQFPEPLTVHCNNLCVDIKQVTVTKYLGLNIDSKLNWKTHIASLKKTSNNFLRSFYHISKVCSEDILKMLYHALLESRLSYGVSLWGGTYYSNIRSLHIAQKRALRTMAKRPRRCSSFPLFQHYNVLPLQHLFIFKVLLAFYKRSGIKGPPSNHETTRYQANRPHPIPRPFNQFFKQTFIYLGPYIMNKLPPLPENRYSFVRFAKEYLLTTPSIDFLL